LQVLVLAQQFCEIFFEEFQLLAQILVEGLQLGLLDHGLAGFDFLNFISLKLSKLIFLDPLNETVSDVNNLFLAIRTATTA